MPESRRRLLIAFASTLGLCASKSLFANPPTQASPQFKPYPNGRDPNVPVRNDEPSRVDPRAVELANRQKFREDVSKLYEMVSELKEEVGRTDPNTTLSLPLVKKTEQIAKLAKQIKSLAKS